MDNNWKVDLIDALIANKLHKAQNLVLSNIPMKLYKHFSVTDNTLDSLNKESVWLSDPSSFNDPYDSSSSLLEEFMELGWEEKARGLNFTEDEISSINVEKKAAEKAKHREDMKQLRQSLRVSCFSEVNDSILMWAHYADQHKGICVEYDLTSLVSTLLPPKCLLFPVSYSETLFDVRPYLNNKVIHPLAPLLCSLYKFNDWHYEKEWRLITASGVMPNPGHMRIPKPTAIYLGTNIDPEHRKTLEELAFQKGIKLFQADFDHSRFAMHFSEISLTRTGSTQNLTIDSV